MTQTNFSWTQKFKNLRGFVWEVCLKESIVNSKWVTHDDRSGLRFEKKMLLVLAYSVVLLPYSFNSGCKYWNLYILLFFNVLFENRLSLETYRRIWKRRSSKQVSSPRWKKGWPKTLHSCIMSAERKGMQTETIAKNPLSLHYLNQFTNQKWLSPFSKLQEKWHSCWIASLLDVFQFSCRRKVRGRTAATSSARI